VSCSPLAAIVEHHAVAPAAGLTPSSPIHCTALRAIVPARCCALRQKAARVQVTKDRHRGTASEFPSCLRCAEGRAIREALGASVDVGAVGGARGGFHRQARRSQAAREAQAVARRRLELVGALDVPPCLDEPPAGEPDEDGTAV
jgi:hypothetical protein